MYRLSVARAAGLRPPIRLLATSVRPMAAAATCASPGSGSPPFTTLVEMQEKYV